MIYLHPPSSHPALLALLRPLLPSSMLLYNTILLPSNSDLPIWCSFPPAAPPQAATPPEAPSPAPPSAQQGRGWVIIADHGNQLRLFHPLEAAGEGSVGEGEQEEQAEADKLVLSCLKAWFAQLPAERSGPINLGAVHERWLPMLKREVNPTSCFEYWVHLSRDLDEAEQKNEGDVAAEVPEGMWITEAREEDVDEILSTSEVAHQPSYIISRLPHSTALYAASSSPPSSAAETGSSAPGPSPLTGKTELVASCFTHRDGSLGTLYVSPDYRRRGLAQVVIRARQAALLASISVAGSGAQTEKGEVTMRPFAYVGESNTRSRALMARLGWGKAWTAGWVRTDRRVWAELQ